MKLLKIERCRECMYYEDEEIDSARGSTYYPPFCRLKRRTILVEDKKQPFPEWCPLEDAPLEDAK